MADFSETGMKGRIKKETTFSGPSVALASSKDPFWHFFTQLLSNGKIFRTELYVKLMNLILIKFEKMT